MPLLDALGVNSVDDIDPERPISLGSITIGSEAAREAVSLLSAGTPLSEMRVDEAPVLHGPFYWSVARMGSVGEIVGLPTLANVTAPLPTAIEVGIVRALHFADAEQQARILAGNCHIQLGESGLCDKFHRIISGAAPPLSGESLLWAKHTQAILTDPDDSRITTTIIDCFKNSFVASPLKFRVLELYRVMESLFLEEIRQTLVREFSTNPGGAVAAAEKSLKSEMEQFVALADRYKEPFEYIWLSLFDIKTKNRFSAALFRKLSIGEYKAPEWKAGAALLYYIRCAVVHAGNKDLIFDAYDDGAEALITVVPFVESAALGLSGISTS